LILIKFQIRVNSIKFSTKTKNNSTTHISCRVRKQAEVYPAKRWMLQCKCIQLSPLLYSTNSRRMKHVLTKSNQRVEIIPYVSPEYSTT
jgi:hypothetical protein